MFEETYVYQNRIEVSERMNLGANDGKGPLDFSKESSCCYWPSSVTIFPRIVHKLDQISRRIVLENMHIIMNQPSKLNTRRNVIANFMLEYLQRNDPLSAPSFGRLRSLFHRTFGKFLEVHLASDAGQNLEAIVGLHRDLDLAPNRSRCFNHQIPDYPH
jgi:hypothetical protein